MTDPRDRTILVIEDNQVVSMVLQRCFARERREHLRVEVATNGLEGYQAACARRPDLIIVDLMMPVYDGRAFLELAVRGGKLEGVPIIIHSALEEDEILGVIAQFPVVKGYLRKPVSPTKLVQMIRQHLEG